MSNHPSDLKQAKRIADLRHSLSDAFDVLDGAIDNLEEEYDVLLEMERAALDLLFETAMGRIDGRHSRPPSSSPLV